MNDNLNALPIGTELNHYVIEAVLGSGGFGIVYKAHHAHLDEQVVIKEFLPVELAGRHGNTVAPHGTSKQEVYSECLRRFMEEGRTLVKLRHPNVVRCRDLFTANGTAYLVMDFEDGLPLDELVRSLEAQGSRYTEQQLLHFLLPLADGLAYIHSQGVLHRDIKPANVFIRRSDGSPVIIDFGAAKQNFALASQSQAPFTEFYAPIEQIDGGGEARPAIDIHAFGALMFRVVAGQIGPKAEARAMALAYGKPDPMLKASDLMGQHYSEAFLSLIDQCLAFKASDRPQSMQEVRQRLAPQNTVQPVAGPLHQAETEPPVVKGRPLRLSWLIVAAVLLVALAGYGLYPLYNAHLQQSVQLKVESNSAKPLRLQADDAYYKRGNNGEAFPLYKQAAELGSAHADAQLAKMYFQGWGVAKNTELAKQHQTLAKQKFAQSNNLDGYEYFLLGSLANTIDQDVVAAQAYYRQAIAQNNAMAQSALGYMYHIGKGVTQSNDDAVHWYRLAAEQGYPNGQNNLAVMYRDGSGVPQSDTEAVNWYRKAAEQGYVFAQQNLGFMYRHGRGVAQSDAEAVKWYRLAAGQGSAEAQVDIGWMYEVGRGEPQSFVEAAIWYRKAAEQGNGVAQNNLGILFRDGRGVEKSDIEAINWFRKAAEQGHAGGQVNLGFMYRKGRGVEQSDTAAVSWYRQAAEQNNAAAQNNLGYMYEDGLGVTQSYTEAVTWYRKAAEQGHDSAQNNLAILYRDGRGVEQSYSEAENWFRKAAVLGNASAQTNLGNLYYNGHGVTQSYKDALQWYRKAAEKNDAGAQHNLGVLYRFGYGVPASIDEAQSWYRKAAQNGHKGAQSYLSQSGQSW